MICRQPVNRSLQREGTMAHLETRVYEISTDKLKKEKRPLRILLLADLHNRLWGAGQQQLLDAVDRFSADMVLCAGDMVLGREHAGMEQAVLLFEGLAERKLTVIAGNGNHESRMRQRPEHYGTQYGSYAGRLRKLGVRIPVNEACRVNYGSVPVYVYGYEMPLEYYKKFWVKPYNGKDLYQKLGTPKEKGFHILLAHNPVYFRHYVRWGADLTLAGHLHGGIVRLPGIGGVITPQAKLFPRYDRGLYEKHGKYMVVSPGLGEHTISFRICNPPWLIGIIVKGTG